MLGRGVVEHQVDAQAHPAGAQLLAQALQVVHGPQRRIDLPVVGNGVPAIGLALPWAQQGHQVQVPDVQLRQVVEVVGDPCQRAGEPVRVAHVADHRRLLEPVRPHRALQVERHQRCRPIPVPVGKQLDQLDEAAVSARVRTVDADPCGLQVRPPAREPDQEQLHVPVREPRQPGGRELGCGGQTEPRARRPGGGVPGRRAPWPRW